MRLVTRFGAVGALAVLMWPAVAPSAEMRGVTATEIRIGQTMPCSGPVSAFGALGKGEVGYFRMLNERGGINGRTTTRTQWAGGLAQRNPPIRLERTADCCANDLRPSRFRYILYNEYV